MMDRQIKILVSLLLAVFVILFLRLFQLQILEGRTNRFLAENNRIAKINIEAPRGLILDRHGEILADNEPLYFLGEKQLARDEALRLQAENKDADLKIVLRRKYPEGETFSHAVGYLGEVSDEELKGGKLDLRGYRPGSWVGRVGVEEKYEELLKGHEGSEMVEVDTQGKVIRRMGRILPKPGEILTLAVDKKLQKVAAQAFSKAPASQRRGAVMATNPENGEVLLLYSSPSFNPNLFVSKKEREALTKLITDEENRPLFNRVISGLYPPGSTFKIVTAMAGLEEKKINSETLINDPGVIYIGNFKYANWYFTNYGLTEGEINVARAITRSTDTFFYKVGEMVGPEKLSYWANKFNLEKIFGIDLLGEVAGFVGTPEWKEKVKKENWFLGNTYHIAIGQGDVNLTPLGVNLMTGVVANGGKICLPRMLRLGEANTPYQAECRDIGVKKEYLEVIRKGMIGACLSGGTGTPFFDFKPKVACKTGTAETGDGKTTHAWFTVFVPAYPADLAGSAGKPAESEIPPIVLTVLVEHGGEGSAIAASMAKEILEEYFRE